MTSVTASVSTIASIPEVRRRLVALQRACCTEADAVMEGRDIGSVIFPDAHFRFFLHADPTERARRRAVEGHHDSIAERDRIDSTRKTAPLACPPGAVSIDTTHLTPAQVVETLAAPIAAKLAPA